MKIIKEIVGDTYQKLIEYIFENCDIATVTFKYNQHENRTKKVLKKIIKETNYSEAELLNFYNEDFIEELSEELMNNSNIFDDEYKEKWNVLDNSQVKSRFIDNDINRRKDTIKYALTYLSYEYKTKKWLKKYESYIITHNFSYFEHMNSKIPYTEVYYLKINEKLKKELLEKKSFLDWIYPNSIEDISFFKNNSCWLYNISHEGIIEINCVSKEEYITLKNMGIIFNEKQFTPRIGSYKYEIEKIDWTNINNILEKEKKDKLNPINWIDGDIFAYKMNSNEYPKWNKKYLIFIYNEITEWKLDPNIKTVRIKITDKREIPKTQEEIEKLEYLKISCDFYDVELLEEPESILKIQYDTFGYVYKYLMKLIIKRNQNMKGLIYLGNFQINSPQNEYIPKNKNHEIKASYLSNITSKALSWYYLYNKQEYHGFKKKNVEYSKNDIIEYWLENQLFYDKYNKIMKMYSKEISEKLGIVFEEEYDDEKKDENNQNI